MNEWDIHKKSRIRGHAKLKYTWAQYWVNFVRSSLNWFSESKICSAHCPPSILMVMSLGISMIFQATTGKKPEIFAWILC